jgi:hypothetical protein
MPPIVRGIVEGLGLDKPMTNGIRVVHTRVFAYGPDGGNPCPVIPFADKRSDGEMQAIARKFGLDTVFILDPTLKASDIRLRYFVPDHEMGVSGHATVAALTVARLEGLHDSSTLNSLTPDLASCSAVGGQALGNAAACLEIDAPRKVRRLSLTKGSSGRRGSIPERSQPESPAAPRCNHLELVSCIAVRATSIDPLSSGSQVRSTLCGSSGGRESGS